MRFTDSGCRLELRGICCIFMLRLPCAAMRTSQAALQSSGGQRCVRTLASCCVAPVANMVIHAADCTANL
jgi:hypothetical protein